MMNSNHKAQYQTTDEDVRERRVILNLIYSNDEKSLRDMKLKNKDLNWLEQHNQTDLDN